jgi:nicotinamidase-related amidase
MRNLLIVVDMQNDFVTGALRNEEAIKIVPNVVERIKKAKKEGYTVIFTKDSHNGDYLKTEEGKNLPVEHCIAGTVGWKIIDELQKFVERDTIVFDKDTFGSRFLASYLERNSYDRIELIGVCTDICVIANAIVVKTFQPNAHIVVDASCCAGVTVESHKTSLNAMKALQIEVING